MSRWSVLRARLRVGARAGPPPSRWPLALLVSTPSPAILWVALMPPPVRPVDDPPPAPTVPPSPYFSPVDRPCPPGTMCSPILLSAPAAVDGNTRDAPESVVHRWPCAPDTPEDGPERWYAVRLEQPAHLIASIHEDPYDGVDVDLHLLSSPDPQSCVRRSNVAVEADLPAGTWYIVVDTCSSTGTPLPGAYHLEITAW